MKWNYAELSKAAKSAGGPEALVELLEKSGKTKMVPPMILVGMICLGAGWGISKVAEFLKNKKEISDQEVQKAKQEIIDGINAYDAAHKEIGEEDNE